MGGGSKTASKSGSANSFGASTMPRFQVRPCSAACCTRSLVAAAFCVRAVRSSCLNSCAA
jgi:hypothetical protein